MKNKLLKNSSKFTGYMLVLLMITLNLSLATPARAVGETLTIGSQTASNGATINVPINANDFSAFASNVGSVTLSIQYDNTLLTYIDTTLNNLPIVAQANLVGDNKIIINWSDATAVTPITIPNDALVTLNFTVSSSATTNTNISFVNTNEVTDGAFDPIDTIFVDGIITLNPDETDPVLSEVTPISTPTNDTTPSYAFTSNELGTISYGGGCTSATTDAVVGSNTITLNTLTNGTYGSCTIIVTDSSGNSSTPLTINTFVINTTAPVITLNGSDSITIEVGATYTDTGATAVDDVDGNISGSINKGGDTVNENISGDYIITYNVTDSAGNTATEVTRTVTIEDTTIPVITLIGDSEITIQAGSTYDDAGATASDNYDDSVVVNDNSDSVNTSVVGTYIITYTATDVSDNSATEVTRTVTVEDTTIPVITLIGDSEITIEVGSTYNDAGATASDNYDGNITGNIIKVNPVNENVLGVYTITYNITDANGNSASEITRTVNVVDTTIPVITLLGSNPITIVMGDEYDDAGATASDNYDGDITGNIIRVNPVNINAIGTYIITYNISDSSSNPAVEVTRTVNIVDGTTPIITLTGGNPATIEVGATYDDAGATAEDDVDGNITDDIITVDSVDPNIIGTYSITYNVSDSSGNPAPEVTRTVTVEDTTIPVITLLGDNPANVEVGYEYNDAGITASDNYDGDITANIITVNPVDFNTVGSYIVTYNITDSSDNSAEEVTRTVNVTPDVTSPVITLSGGNMSIYQDTSFTDPGVTALDNLDGDISENVVVTGDTVDTSATSTYSITYNVTDSAGNTATEVTRTVTVLPIEEEHVVIVADMDIDSNSQNILIGSNAPAVSNISVPSNATDTKLNLSAIMNGTDATLNSSLNINSETSIGAVNVQIPTGVDISGGVGWTGEINLPQVQENSSVTATPNSGYSASVSSVIEIGYGDVELTFNKAVRIKLTGQAGKYVGYSRGGSFTPITAICSEDSQTAGNALADGGDCKIDVGDDLIIWTKHFTKFVSYTQTAIPAPTPTPSGGGGSSYIPASCQSVEYDEWQGTYVNGWQYRNILSRTPSGCALTSEQESQRKRGKVVIQEEEPEQRVLGIKIVSDIIKEVINKEKGLLKMIDKKLSNRVKGRILLQVEEHGEAWYVNPKTSKRYYMANGEEAYSIMRNLSIGITNKDLERVKTDKAFAKKHVGKIFLQVEEHGEAYYIDFDGNAHYLKNGSEAYAIMRELGLGITNNDLRKIDMN